MTRCCGRWRRWREGTGGARGVTLADAGASMSWFGGTTAAPGAPMDWFPGES